MLEVKNIDSIKTKKAIIYAIFIWATMFIVASIVVGYGFGDWTKYGIMWLISVAVAWTVATRLRIKGLKLAVSYGAIFLIIGFLLDLLITTKFTGSAIFSSFDYWVGYGLTFLTVLYKGYISK